MQRFISNIAAHYQRIAKILVVFSLTLLLPLSLTFLFLPTDAQAQVSTQPNCVDFPGGTYEPVRREEIAQIINNILIELRALEANPESEPFREELRELITRVTEYLATLTNPQVTPTPIVIPPFQFCLPIPSNIPLPSITLFPTVTEVPNVTTPTPSPSPTLTPTSTTVAAIITSTPTATPTKKPQVLGATLPNTGLESSLTLIAGSTLCISFLLICYDRFRKAGK